MSLRQHVLDHGIPYAITGVLGLVGLLAWAGALAYLDARHIQHREWVEHQIQEQDAQIERLQLYNEFGTEGNRAARDQVILRTEHRKQELERELDRLKE